MSLRPRQKLEHYEILARVGAGGMGEVYKVRDLKLHRDVAIKVLHDWIASALWQRGSYEEALTEIRRARGEDSELTAEMERAFRTDGPRAAMHAAADLLAETPMDRGTVLSVASYYAAAGEAELAFQWLERAFDERVPQLLHVTANPRFDPIRDDPRFEELLRRMRLPS